MCIIIIRLWSSVRGLTSTTGCQERISYINLVPYRTFSRSLPVWNNSKTFKVECVPWRCIYCSPINCVVDPGRCWWLRWKSTSFHQKLRLSRWGQTSFPQFVRILIVSESGRFSLIINCGVGAQWTVGGHHWSAMTVMTQGDWYRNCFSYRSMLPSNPKTYVSSLSSLQKLSLRWFCHDTMDRTSVV